MPATKAKATKRMEARAVEDDVLATACRLATALHRVGALDAVDRRDLNRLLGVDESAV